MNKKIVIVVFFIASFFAGFFWGKVVTESKRDLNDTFDMGWDAAKKRLNETGFLQDIDRNIVAKAITGTITSVGQNKFTVKIAPLEPIADPDLDSRIVEIGNNTEIYKIVEKDRQKYRQEIEEFKKNNQELMIGSEFDILKPSMYTQKEATSKELMKNQIVIVRTSEDILNKKQFIAQEIIIKK